MARAFVVTLLATTVLLASPAPRQTPQHKNTPASVRSPSTAKRAPAHKSAPTHPSTTAHNTGAHPRTVALSRKGKTHGRRVVHTAPAPSYQLHPDPERYQQIQQALAERGYFKGTVNGQWNDDSIDAVKHFQTDQKLDPQGKIDALTLTGLGLGPRHDGSTAATVPLSATDSAITPLDPVLIPPPLPQ